MQLKVLCPRPLTVTIHRMGTPCTRRLNTLCTLTSGTDTSSRKNGLQRSPDSVSRNNGSIRITLSPSSLNGNSKTLNGMHQNGKHKNGVHQNGAKRDMSDDALPLSLYVPFESLPPDGKFQTEDEENCDPETRNCQTAIYVWEDKCKACSGTGSFKSVSKSRRRGSNAVCLCCHGLGYVRKTSSRVAPDTSASGNGTSLTLNRDAPRPSPNGKASPTANGKPEKTSKPTSYWRTRNLKSLKKLKHRAEEQQE